jgi:hypothetical protein
VVFNDLYLCRKFLRFLHFLHRILKVVEFIANSVEFATNYGVFDERVVVLDLTFICVLDLTFATNLPKHLEFSKIDVIFAPRLMK